MSLVTDATSKRRITVSVDAYELNALRKFWNENQGSDGNETLTQPADNPGKRNTLDKEEAIDTIEFLISRAHKNANMNVSEKCKDYADAAASIAQAVLAMEKV